MQSNNGRAVVVCICFPLSTDCIAVRRKFIAVHRNLCVFDQKINASVEVKKQMRRQWNWHGHVQRQTVHKRSKQTHSARLSVFKAPRSRSFWDFPPARVKMYQIQWHRPPYAASNVAQIRGHDLRHKMISRRQNHIHRFQLYGDTAHKKVLILAANIEHPL